MASNNEFCHKVGSPLNEEGLERVWTSVWVIEPLPDLAPPLQSSVGFANTLGPNRRMQKPGIAKSISVKGTSILSE
jgi:hypothetical protein